MRTSALIAAWRHARAIIIVTIGVAGFSRTVLAQSPDLDPRIVTLVQSVSEERLIAILKKLESFGTRHTLSSIDKPDKGIGAARQWILQEMTSYSPRLQVAFDSHVAPKQGRITREVEIRNVM